MLQNQTYIRYVSFSYLLNISIKPQVVNYQSFMESTIQ